MDPESPEAFRALIDQSTDLITLLDADGNIQYQSPSVTRLLGYEESELVGRNAFELVHPEDRERVLEKFEELVGSPGARVEREEHRIRHADGSWIWFESTTTNRTDTVLDGYVINSRDVTERRTQRQKLEEEHEKYETLTEQSHDAITIIRNGTFEFVNRRASVLSGYSEAELLGMSFLDLVAPADREMVAERHEGRLDPEAESDPQRYEIRFHTKSGDERIAEASVASIRYDGGPAVLATFRDVTERKRYEDQLQYRADELEALNRLLRHDIRNDMNVMLGWADILADHVDDEGTAYLEKLTASGEHVVDLTAMAREFVDVVVGTEELGVEPTRLRPVLENELDRKREMYADATFTVEGEVPDVTVGANELLPSVFRNLLGNAVQHNDVDHPAVEVTCDRLEDAVRIRIADDGPGVPDEQKEAIFAKGEKGPASEGTGIGLYLVKTLVESYDGQVWVEDAEPRGAAFVVELPLSES